MELCDILLKEDFVLFHWLEAIGTKLSDNSQVLNDITSTKICNVSFAQTHVITRWYGTTLCIIMAT